MKPLVYCAQYYADQWANQDMSLFEGLAPPNDRTTRLATLTQICRKYKIARNLPRKYDEGAGLQRYEPLLAIIDECREVYPATSDPDEVVCWFADRVAKLYGGVSALSLSSKVLWFVYRSPVLIYDQLAREALGVRAGNYDAYQSQWRASYSKLESELSAASSSFSNEQWFKDRIFDIYLWHIGNDMKSNKASQPTPTSGRG